MEKNSSTPATKRQLWALYCITKQDWRNKNISKDEASKLINKLNNKNNKMKQSLSDELLDYLKDNFDSIFERAINSMKCKSVVEDELTKQKYAFIGVGCGITYPTYRKNNKRAQEIATAANKYYMNELLNIFYSKFTSEEIHYYQNIGNPLGAIWSQDQGIQISYWQMVKKFAESKGIKIDYKTFLD